MQDGNQPSRRDKGGQVGIDEGPLLMKRTFQTNLSNDASLFEAQKQPRHSQLLSRSNPETRVRLPGLSLISPFDKGSASTLRQKHQNYQLGQTLG